MDPTGDEQNKKTGKWMLALAWISALLLFTLFFDDQLSKQYNPNQQPISQRNTQQAEVRLKQNKMGHYITNGTINGQNVIFLLDTGATQVSIPAHLASQLALEAGYAHDVMTANGRVKVYSTKIDNLSIGDIELNRVSANLNPGMSGNEILLGMSALKQLDFSQINGWLILKQKY